jgi:hypothetical protein
VAQVRSCHPKRRYPCQGKQITSTCRLSPQVLDRRSYVAQRGLRGQIAPGAHPGFVRLSPNPACPEFSPGIRFSHKAMTVCRFAAAKPVKPVHRCEKMLNTGIQPPNSTGRSTQSRSGDQISRFADFAMSTR